MARVCAVFRRHNDSTKEASSQEIRVDNLQIQMENNVVLIDSKPVNASRKEIDLLWTLASYPTKVFARENLLNTIWGMDYYGDARTVDSRINRLRAKLEKFDHPRWQIKTVWQIGYQFEIITLAQKDESDS